MPGRLAFITPYPDLAEFAHQGAFIGVRKGGKKGYFELAHRGTLLRIKVGLYMQFRSEGTTCSKYFFIWGQLTGRNKTGSFSFSASVK